MNLKNLKNKVVRNLPEILGVTVAAAVVTAAVVVVVKTLKDASIATSFRDSLSSDGPIDLSSLEETEFLHDMIGEATEASITFLTKNEAIIFLSK